jgi:hypothetical protein
MFEGDLELTIEEEEKIQNPANIYSLIRTLQFIEWAYNFSHIDRETYIRETNIILEQYKNAVMAYPEFKGLPSFVQEYNLQDCTYAINRINQGNVQNTSKPVLADIQKMTQYFNDLNIFLDQENLSVTDILSAYNDLCNSLEKLKNFIKLDNEDIAKVKKTFLHLKNEKKPADILTEDERSQMKADLQLANSTISTQLSNTQ